MDSHQTDSASICPESTIESANRRTFIRKAAYATAAAGIGGYLLAKPLSLKPESSAASSAVTTDSACSNPTGSLAVFDGKSDITGSSRVSPATLCGSVPCSSSLLSVKNTGCNGVGVYGSGNSAGVSGCSSSGYGVIGNSNGFAAVRGINCQGTGVYGCSLCGCGVVGVSCCGGYGVYGRGGGGGVVGRSGQSPGVTGQSCCCAGICAKSSSSTIGRFTNIGTTNNKTANILFQNGCSTPVSWYEGVGGAGNVHGLSPGQFFLLGECQPRLVVNTCGKVGIGTIAPNATLQVNGGVSLGTKIETANYTMTSSDFAVLVNAASKAITVTLPPASNTGQVVHVKKIDSSKNKVTVSRQGSNTIEGAPSRSLSSEYGSLTLIAGGNDVWYILSSAT